MSSPIILLASKDPLDLAFAQAVAAEGRFTLRQTADYKEAAEAIRDEEIMTVLARADEPAAYASFETAITDIVGLFSERVNSNRFHFLANADASPGSLAPLFAGPLLGHLIRVPSAPDAVAAKRYSRIIEAGGAPKPRVFGPEGLIGAKQVQSIKLTHSRQRPEAIDAVKNYLVAAKFQTRMSAIIANAVDELLMNAIFDAPVDTLGKSLHARTSRSADFALDEKNAVETRIAFHDGCAAITVLDGFGSVDRANMLTTLAKDYRAQNYKVRTLVENAGLGLASILNIGGSLFISCERQTRTESTIVFQRTLDFKEFRKQFQSFSAIFFE